MSEGKITLFNVKPAVGFTHPGAGVTPAPNVEKKVREFGSEKRVSGWCHSEAKRRIAVPCSALFTISAME
jgi:hypothetical protein